MKKKNTENETTDVHNVVFVSKSRVLGAFSPFFDSLLFFCFINIKVEKVLIIQFYAFNASYLLS